MSTSTSASIPEVFGLGEGGLDFDFGFGFERQGVSVALRLRLPPLSRSGAGLFGCTSTSTSTSSPPFTELICLPTNQPSSVALRLRLQLGLVGEGGNQATNQVKGGCTSTLASASIPGIFREVRFQGWAGGGFACASTSASTSPHSRGQKLRLHFDFGFDFPASPILRITKLIPLNWQTHYRIGAPKVQRPSPFANPSFITMILTKNVLLNDLL